ncbi:MAG: non-canonical purine NTP pyrophosphatase, partial [bacterium]|nr:non-canonical purine NTP pyrophosphatase [bacterium]
MKKKSTATIVLATHNRDKIREFNAKLGNRIQLKTLDDFPDFPEVAENGGSIRENAYIKARAIHAHTGLPAVADDTGLEVDALDGAPGVYSSRFAGENASYRDNVQHLLKQMKGIPQEQRSARFRTSIAYVDNQEAWDVEGFVEGCILKEVRGEGGFGYDPL